MQNDFDHNLSLSVGVAATDRAVYSSFPSVSTRSILHARVRRFLHKMGNLNVCLTSNKSRVVCEGVGSVDIYVGVIGIDGT